MSLPRLTMQRLVDGTGEQAYRRRPAFVETTDFMTARWAH
jgi:hypothetical protein